MKTPRPVLKTYVAAIMTTMVCSVVLSAAVRAETLQQTLAMVYEGNPAIQSERATLRETDEGVAAAVAGWRPTANAQVQTGYAHREYNTSTGDLHSSDVGLNVSQPIYRGGRTVAAMRQAEAQVSQERAKLAATEQSVFLDAATSYMDVVQGRLVARLYEANQSDLENWVKETQERHGLGDKTATDVSQAQARLADAVAQFNTAQIDLQSAKAAYLRYTGQAPGTLQRWPQLADILPKTQEAALSQAEKESPVVLQAQYATQAGEEAIRQVRGSLLPEVSLQGQLSHSWNENVPQIAVQDNHAVDDQVMLQLKMPLYAGGATYARLRAAYIDRSAKRRDLDEARREARQQTQQAWAQERITAGNIDIRKRQIVQAQQALDGMKKEERVGDRSSTDRLSAMQDLLNARVAEVRAEHDHTVALFRLMSALGVFTAEKLQLPVTPYDTQKHYLQDRHRWAGLGNAAQER